MTGITALIWSYYEFHFQKNCRGSTSSPSNTHAHRTSLFQSAVIPHLLPYKVIEQARPTPPLCCCCCCHWCCRSNCCCCFASSFPAEPRHPCLTLFSNMQSWWQVLEFPLKLPVPIVQQSTPPSPPSPPYSSLSLFEALWDDDDTHRNQRMLSFWHDTRLRNPFELIQVSLLHSGTVRPLTSGKAFHRRIENSARWGLDWQPCWESKASSCTYLISAQQLCTFALLTCVFVLTGSGIR